MNSPEMLTLAYQLYSHSSMLLFQQSPCTPGMAKNGLGLGTGLLGKAQHQGSSRAGAKLSVFKVRCLFQLSANPPPPGLRKPLLSVWCVVRTRNED